MAAVEINWQPTDRQLRQFGAISLVALPLLGWLFSGRVWPGAWEAWHVRLLGSLLGIGVLLATISWVYPRAIKPLFLALTIVAFPIGFVLSEVVMLLIFVLAFMPFALVFRLIGRDALARTLERDQTSYWQAKQPPQGVESYFRQS